MKLSDLIDKKISKIRFNYTLENEQGVKEFQSQIRLSNKEVILIPNYPDTDYDLLEDYQKNKTSTFQKAKRCGLASRLLFRNRKIVDIHFEYQDNEPQRDGRGILELDNGKYITENYSGLQGLGEINLVVMDKSQFQELANNEVEFRSLKKDILAD